MDICRSVEKLAWLDHPMATGVKIKPMISKKGQGDDVTCMLVEIPMGAEVPVHMHEDQEDILYPLQGKATMWVDGAGSFSLEPGVIIRVPRGTEHMIKDVTEPLLIYDVFCPALM
jgi:quercetin dioxygenase-like cupin family protein